MDAGAFQRFEESVVPDSLFTAIGAATAVVAGRDCAQFEANGVAVEVEETTAELLQSFAEALAVLPTTSAVRYFCCSYLQRTYSSLTAWAAS